MFNPEKEKYKDNLILFEGGSSQDVAVDVQPNDWPEQFLY